MSPTPIVSTGALPSHEEVQALLEEAYAACIPIDDGQVADHIPALAAAPGMPSAPASPAGSTRSCGARP